MAKVSHNQAPLKRNGFLARWLTAFGATLARAEKGGSKLGPIDPHPPGEAHRLSKDRPCCEWNAVVGGGFASWVWLSRAGLPQKFQEAAPCCVARAAICLRSFSSMRDTPILDVRAGCTRFPRSLESSAQRKEHAQQLLRDPAGAQRRAPAMPRTATRSAPGRPPTRPARRSNALLPSKRPLPPLSPAN